MDVDPYNLKALTIPDVLKLVDMSARDMSSDWRLASTIFDEDRILIYFEWITRRHSNGGIITTVVYHVEEVKQVPRIQELVHCRCSEARIQAQELIKRKG